MSQSFLPQFNMPIVDKNGKASMQLQQFFMRLVQGNGTLSVTVAGQKVAARTINFGDGFSGTFSGTALDLSSGVDILDDQGGSFTTNTIEFGAGFSVTETASGVTINGGGTSLGIFQNGVQISDGVDLLNFTGNVQVKMIGDEVYIAVGGVEANGDNGNYSNLVAGAGITLTPDGAGDLTLSASAAEFIQGTITTTGALTIGSNLLLSGDTLNASGAGGSETITHNGTVLTTAATEINFSGMTYAVSGGTVTIPDATSIAASGVVGVWDGGTLYPTIAAGSGVTFTPSGETLTVSASGGSGASGIPLTFSSAAYSSPINGGQNAYECTNFPALTVGVPIEITVSLQRPTTSTSIVIYIGNTSGAGYLFASQGDGNIVQYKSSSFNQNGALNASGGGTDPVYVGSAELTVALVVEGASSNIMLTRSPFATTTSAHDTSFDLSSGTLIILVAGPSSGSGVNSGSYMII